MSRMSFFEVVCTGIRGSPGAQKAFFLKAACTTFNYGFEAPTPSLPA